MYNNLLLSIKKGVFIINNNLSLRFSKIKEKIKEYIKFNIIGTINFVVSQGLYLILYLYFHINYIVAYTITSVISITASYFFNSKYTFKENHYTLKKYILSILVYLFEYALNLGLILLLVNKFSINKAIAPIISPIFSTIPVFFLMRLVIKNKHKKDKYIKG